MSKNFSIRELKVIFIVFFIWGCVVSFLVPTWQVPDESTHLNQIGESIGIANLGTNWITNCSVEFGRLVHNKEQNLSIEEWNNYSKIKCDKDFLKQSGINIRASILKHFSATIGIIIGILLNMPITYTLLLAEIISLAFYMFVCYQAVKITPIKQEVFLIVCFLPMCMQQAASISYDALFISLSILFIAYILYLKYEKEYIGCADLLKLIFLLFYFTYIKLPFIVLGVLILSLPVKKIKIKFKTIDAGLIKKIVVCGVVVILIVGIAILKFYDSNIFINIVSSSLTHPMRTSKLFIATIKRFGVFLTASFIGCLGWLDTNLPDLYILYTWVMLITFTIFNSEYTVEKTKNNNRIYDFCIWFISFVLMGYFTLLSMVNHTYTITLYGYEVSDQLYDVNEAMNLIPYIGGLQGRYFIVIFLVLFIAFPGISKLGKRSTKTLLMIYFVLTISVTTMTLIERYWI